MPRSRRRQVLEDPNQMAFPGELEVLVIARFRDELTIARDVKIFDQYMGQWLEWGRDDDLERAIDLAKTIEFIRCCRIALDRGRGEDWIAAKDKRYREDW
jgi:hypothetical protein